MGRVDLPKRQGTSTATGIVHPSRRRSRTTTKNSHAQPRRIDHTASSTKDSSTNVLPPPNEITTQSFEQSRMNPQTNNGTSRQKMPGMDTNARGFGDSTTRRHSTTTTTAPPTLPTATRRPRQALAIDTRLIVSQTSSPSNDKEEDKVTCLYQSLLQHLAKTGIIPCAYACTALARGAKSIVLETGVIDDAQRLESLTVKPVVFKVNKQQVTTDCPKPLLAKNTWKLFRGLVDSICSNFDDKDTTTNVPSQPLDVTLLMRTDSLVGEHAAHAEGFSGAIQHLRSYFDCSKIQSICLVLVVDPNEQGDVSVPSVQETLEKALQQQLQAPPDSQSSKNKNTRIPGLPVDISIVSIDDNHLGYKKLARQLMRQSLSGGLGSGRLSIDLPETVDGTQCQLWLEARYNLFATSFQNDMTWDQFARDLQTLARACPLQVQQLVPYSALDASLLFGVPLRLSATSSSSSAQEAQDSFADFETMQVLFSSLLRLLEERGLVLLLQVPKTANGGGGGGVWLGRPGQTLALMARETQGTSSSPTTGLLWGYATDCQLFLEEDDLANSQSCLDEETTWQLKSYVDASLENVVCGPYNPLVTKPRDLLNTLAQSQNVPSQEEPMDIDTDTPHE